MNLSEQIAIALATIEKLRGEAVESAELAAAADFARALAEELDRLAGRVAAPPVTSEPTPTSSRRTPRGRDPSTRRSRRPSPRA